MFKPKIKKLVTGLVSIAISTALLTGCGSDNKEFQGQIDKIINGKTALLEANNISLTRNIIQETEGEKQKTLNEVVVNNITKEWYMKTSNMDGVLPNVLGESLVLEGKTFIRGKNDDRWSSTLQSNLQSNLQSAVGVSDISYIDLETKDFKNIKATSEAEKETYEIIMSEYYLKRLKEKGIKKVEEMLKEAKADNNSTEAIIENTEMSLDLLKKTNYISSECIFTLDKTGVLIGYKFSYVLEQPNMELGNDGKMNIADEMITLAMTSEIVIEAYNNSSNVKFIESVKSEL